MKFLVSIGISCEATTVKGITALGIAAEHNHLDIVKFLQYKKCSLTNCGEPEEDNTPLSLSCRKRNINVIKYLIQFKEVKEQIYKFNCSPLIHSIQSNHIDIINLLKDLESMTSAKDNNERSVLHEIAKCGLQEHINILFSKCKYSEDKNGTTPMIEALQNHNFNVADSLYTYNISPLESSSKGFNIINLLSVKYDSEIVAYLKSKCLYDEEIHPLSNAKILTKGISEAHIKIEEAKFISDNINKTPILSQRVLPKKEKEAVSVIKASMEGKRLLPSLERSTIDMTSPPQIAYPKPHNYYSTISNRLMRDFGNAFTLERQPIKETEVLLHEVQSKFQSILSSSKPYATPVKKQKKQLLEALRRKNSKY